MSNYESIVELAIGMAKETTREKVSQSTFYPFQLLYVEMAKRKEIPAMIELSEEVRRGYWNEAKAAQPNEKRYKQIWVAQGLRMFDLITCDEIKTSA